MEPNKKVFISSTSEDLHEYREAAEQAVKRAWHDAELFEHWPASANKPLDQCLARVEQADLVIVIVAHRYGWVPDGEEKSITRLECERAWEKGIDIIPFIADESAHWRPEHYEFHRFTEASKSSVADPLKLQALSMEVGNNTLKINQFKDWLNGIGIRAVFDIPDKLHNEIERALMERLREGTGERSGDAIRASYLKWVAERFGSVELLGLDPKHPHNVRLNQVYVPALCRSVKAWGEATGEELFGFKEFVQTVIHVLGHGSLYLYGDAGSGKSTFCRWLALSVAAGRVPEHPIPVSGDYTEHLADSFVGKLPVLCPLRELAGLPDCLRGNGHWSRKELERALGCWIDTKGHGGLTGTYLLQELSAGRCLLILDGVDELPVASADGDRPRRNLLSGLEEAAKEWQRLGNRLLLTSRPYGVGSEEQSRLGLHPVPLERLDDELQRVFIHRWYAAVDPQLHEEKATGLVEHLDGRPDLTELRANPMLLTALCVKYDEGQRLPQDIYELYDAVVRQVLYKRYDLDGERDRVRRRLATIALGMHTGEAAPGPRATPVAQADFDELEKILADYAQSDSTSEQGECEAHQRLDDLLSHSGLLLHTGGERAGFYHLSFQEFLAATRLMKLHFDGAIDLSVFVSEKAGISEWRKTLTFLFCAADIQSPEGVWYHFAPLLEQLDPEALAANSAPALLLADCLEVASARDRGIEGPLGRFRQACDDALEYAKPPARNQLWLALGRMGLDDRPGVGVVEGVPDIEWCMSLGGGCAVSRYLITNAQFQVFIDDEKGYREERWWEGLVECPGTPRVSNWREPNRPRENVNWYEALAYCRWLSVRTGEEIALPTEAQWEVVARQGHGREFPWGGGFRSKHANIDEVTYGLGSFYIGETSVVGIYPKGDVVCGASDMAGNVAEWCLDEHEVFRSELERENGRRVVRGGSWRSYQGLARCAARSSYHPCERLPTVGFRVVRVGLGP